MLLKQLMQRNELDMQQMQGFTELLLSETAAVEDKVALLTAFTMKGETSNELYSLSHKLIHMMYPEQPYLPESLCVCGTGGDGSNSFNISTTVAFVVAAAGATVIKHGNKSVTSRSGSIDILQALEVPTTLVVDVERQVADTHLAFLSAAETYPIMRHIQPIRRYLPVPTIFNIVGPIINPFKLDYQVMGVYDESKMSTVAQTLLQLGRKRALVVHGAQGMDEATLSGDNIIMEVDCNHGIHAYTLNAQDVGLRYADDEALIGGTPEENKRITLSILKGEDRSCRRDVILLNAGLALYAAQRVNTIAEGVKKAEETIDSGAAYQQYEQSKGVNV
ncbi:anthranilate phosphoribosyltransferase [Staphylococcus sp. 17KM0847]|uniref:anthranilate phosphoribosyltransferase n=1 Tax=Staphylococcus sp. 17KM0847 TaxID=2583989 RepID=UPI0015DBEC08|nr:anthranilate phosphoribosyltransferase [Staphylococcus sp. 17KM0847]QLK86784.1 anthranilate phosphoribosyltransferase [Staphylococcus sp. 17KM0847]